MDRDATLRSDPSVLSIVYKGVIGLKSGNDLEDRWHVENEKKSAGIQVATS